MEPREPEAPGAAAPGRRRAWAGAAILAVWAPLLLLVLGTLMAGHWAPLPRPETRDDGLALRLLTRAEIDGTAGLVAFHVLDSECRCSQRIAEHLAGSERPAGVREVVLLTGPAEPLAGRLEARGFAVLPHGRGELDETLGLASAPMLLLVDAPQPAMRYAGGYTPRQQSLDVRDLALIEEARCTRGVLEALPVFGCGVAPPLRAALDPLGIKY